jgi:N-acetylglucosaminyldiphosphoundecaprenol N-acetyl-beta-D-mannosaminyltransferase
LGQGLKISNPGATCYTLPFFDKNDDNIIQEITDNCVKIILENNIKIVLIGISFPKQNILAINIYNKLKAIQTEQIPLFCMLGASFEFYLRLKKRAPAYVQKFGLEWLHRFSKEPARLFKRYFIDDIGFFPILFKELLKKHP